jgi:hypothetical protein
VTTAVTVVGTVRGLEHNSQRSKTYTPDVLTVDQLVVCLKKAKILDEESDRLNAAKAELVSAGKQIDVRKSDLEIRGATVNRRSRYEVDRFNAELDRYNASADEPKSEKEKFNQLVAIHNTGATDFNTEWRPASWPEFS